MQESPHQPYPKRYDVIGLLVLNLALLSYSYFLPFMNARRYFFFQEEYTLIKSLQLMVEADNHVLAILLFIFTVVFPVGKLCLLLGIWFIPFRIGARNRTMRGVATIGKWSMLDVFIVAIIVVLISARGLTKAEPLPGLYLFAAAILLSMALTQWTQHLVREREPDGRRQPR